MIHDTHYSVLVPPVRVLDALHLSSHDNDLAGWNELASTIRGSKMLGYTGGRNLSIQCLGQTVDHLCPLSRCQCGWWARCKNEVAIKIDYQRIGRRGEQSAALGRDT